VVHARGVGARKGLRLGRGHGAAAVRARGEGLEEGGAGAREEAGRGRGEGEDVGWVRGVDGVRCEVLLGLRVVSGYAGKRRRACHFLERLLLVTVLVNLFIEGDVKCWTAFACWMTAVKESQLHLALEIDLRWL
jgi:hypothetical protein